LLDLAVDIGGMADVCVEEQFQKINQTTGLGQEVAIITHSLLRVGTRKTKLPTTFWII
jgi:hypothetical protein